MDLALSYVPLGGRLHPFVAALLLVAGVFALLFGRRMAWVFTAVMGFLVGLTVGPIVAGPLPGWLQQTVVLMIAVITAFLGLAAHRPAALIVGGLALAGVGRFVAVSLALPEWAGWLLILGGAAAGALLTRHWRESTLIAVSVLYGALATVAVVHSAWPGQPPGRELLLGGVLAAAGLIFQAVSYRNEQELVIPPEAGGLPRRVAGDR